MRVLNLAPAILLCAATACDSRATNNSLIGPGGATSIAAVTVNPPAMTIVVAGTARLTAVAMDRDGNLVPSADISWTSSDPTVALVSPSGVVTAREAGNSQIKASAGGIEGSSLIAVTEAAIVSVVIMSPGDTINALGAVRQLSATATDAGGAAVPTATFAWMSLNPAVATVSTSGKVTAKAVGAALIIATAGVVADTMTVTVRQVPATVALSGTSVTVTVGSFAQIQATVRDSGGAAIPNASVTWSSSAPGVASVSSSGLVTGVGVGTAVVTASAAGASAIATVTVQDALPPPPPPPPSSTGVWISQQEIDALPTSGPAWHNLKATADGDCGTPMMENQDDDANVCIMAKGLVYARTKQSVYGDAVVSAIRSIVNGGTYGGRALALGRELIAYVIAADLIGLRTYDAALDQLFRAKLAELRTTYTAGGPASLIECHEVRPNNWGTHCGASRMAVALYLGDRAGFDRAVTVFRGWLGERQHYAGFEYGDLSWQADPSKPVGINPKGATKDGYTIDGVLPDDQRRCGTFAWPPCKTGYNWEALQGVIAMAWMAHRQGHAAFEWGDQAILRAGRWLYDVSGDIPAGDDLWQPHLLNYVYGTTYPVTTPARPGKNVGWTDWTHGRR